MLDFDVEKIFLDAAMKIAEEKNLDLNSVLENLEIEKIDGILENISKIQDSRFNIRKKQR